MSFTWEICKKNIQPTHANIVVPCLRLVLTLFCCCLGSNIFDVTVGLPVPWLIYTIIYQTHMPVSSVGKVLSTLLFADCEDVKKL